MEVTSEELEFESKLITEQKEIERDLITKYAASIESGKAALFIGSGISTSLNMPNWKTILSDAAAEIDIDMDNTKLSYLDIAQYCINHSNESVKVKAKARLVESIKNLLIEKKGGGDYETSIYRYLCDLPIKQIWTTNYDDLIEYSYKNLTPDVNYISLTSDSEVIEDIHKDSDVFIFHMHGCISVAVPGGRSSNDIILTTEDYVEYKYKHSVFLNLLESGVMLRKFLFMGFSFDDPNLRNLLEGMKYKLKTSEASQPRHYMILYSKVLDCRNVESMKRIDAEERAKIKDLKRYNISTLRVFKSAEPHPLNRIIIDLRNYTFRKNIVVAGSFSEGMWEGISSICNELGSALIKNSNNYVIHTCYGDGVGKNTIGGALDECLRSSIERPNDRVNIWPTYQVEGVDASMVEKNRRLMLRKASVCIFFGGKDGTKEEYFTAKKMKKFLIPIGFSGGVSRELFKDLMDEYFTDMCRLYGLGNKVDEMNVKFKQFNKKCSEKKLLESLLEVLDLVYHNQGALAKT